MAGIRHYFTEEFRGYYKQLEELESLNNYKNSLTDSVNQASEYADSVNNQLLQLAGTSVDQLTEEARYLYNSINKTKDFISNNLSDVLNRCESLRDNLSDLEYEDIKLFEDYNDMCSFQSKNGKKISEGDKTCNYQLSGKRSQVEADIQKCESLEEKVYSDVNAIRNFNSQIEDFSMSLLQSEAAIEYVSRSPDIEAEDRLKSVIDKYQELYDKMKFSSRANEKDGLVSVLKALGYPYDISMDGPFNFESFKKLHSFINYPLIGEKTPIDVINSYFNGESWIDSGMAELSQVMGANGGLRIKNNYQNDWEAEFWRRMIYELDGQEATNNPTPYFYMSTEYFKNHKGGYASYDDFYDMLFVPFADDENDPNHEYHLNDFDGKVKEKYLNYDLINSLKSEFRKEGYLDGLNTFVNKINKVNDEYGDDVLPFLDALDGRMDWNDNNSVIPKDAILKYINGASWEESELSQYCEKSEDQFLADLLKTSSKDYELYCCADYDEWEKQRDTNNQSWIRFNEKDKTSIYGDVLYDDGNGLANILTLGKYDSIDADGIKAILKENGVDKKLSNYYDLVGQRNDQIESETTDMYVVATCVRNLKDELAELNPTEQDKLRKLNEEQGKKIATTYLDAIDTISGRSEHVHIYSQDDYVKMMQEKDPSLSREDILNNCRSEWRQELQNNLIDKKYYNKECARRYAETQTFDNKKVIYNDELNVFESTGYFFRDLAADGVTVVAGTTSGLVDLGRDLKHVVSPDLVPSPLQYAEDEIVKQYNNPNSKYYDPVKGTLFSTTRTIGHEGTVQILKAIPATKSAGMTLEFLQTYGQTKNAAYQANGGNLAAADFNAALHAGTTVAANKISSIANDTGVGRIVSNVIAGEFETAVGEYGDAVSGMQTIDDATNNFGNKQVEIFAKAFSTGIGDFDYVEGGSFKNAVEKAYYDTAKSGAEQIATVAFTNDGSNLNPVKTVTDTISSVGSNYMKYRSAENNYNKAVSNDDVYKVDKTDGTYLFRRNYNSPHDTNLGLEQDYNPITYESEQKGIPVGPVMANGIKGAMNQGNGDDKDHQYDSYNDMAKQMLNTANAYLPPDEGEEEMCEDA